MIRVDEPGALATVQDLGRCGLAHLGVPRAGPLDDVAAALANRLVGNPADAAVVEVTFGGFAVTAVDGHWIAVTGAPCPVRVAGTPVGHGQPVWLPPGARLELGSPAAGVRSYVGVAGGIAVPPVLGSRATDTLAWVGPPPLRPGTELPVGEPAGEPRPHDTPRPPAPGPLRVTPGPRVDWFAPHALAALCGAAYVVQPDSNRIGLRLRGQPLRRTRLEELPSEGVVLGAVQVSPDGQPVVFLADHPPTGGYPVVAVVRRDDLWQCGQLRPGDEVRFSLDRPRRPAATR